MENIQEILTNGKILEIVDYHSDKCLITILGEYNKNKFILKLSKQEYPNDLNIPYNKLLQNVVQTFNNDIYYKFIADDLITNKSRADFVYPADEKVIEKFRRKQHTLFIESYETYLNKSKKYIDSIDPSHTKWVYNILYEGKETPLYKIENELIILKDYKSVDSNALICLGISYSPIKCLRDLNETHLDLLNKFYYQGVKFYYY
jgi:hypothetical protein